MSINLETPKKIRPLIDQAHQVAMNMLRPISRKYDQAEHEYPVELDMLAAMIDGLADSGASEGAGAAGVRRDDKPVEQGNKNGANLASVLSILEMCWGDVGLTLTMPRQGLGNSAIASVAIRSASSFLPVARKTRAHAASAIGNSGGYPDKSCAACMICSKA